MPTQVTGTLGNLIDLQPMDIRSCGPRTTTLAAGHHVISFPSGSAFRVTSLIVRRPKSRPHLRIKRARPRVVVDTGKTNTEAGGRICHVHSGRANFNIGWVATLDGRTLTPVRLSGWEQGWIVPAGMSGVMTMNFKPDQTYRAALLIGRLFLLALLISPWQREIASEAGPQGRGKSSPHSLWLVAPPSEFSALAVCWCSYSFP